MVAVIAGATGLVGSKLLLKLLLNPEVTMVISAGRRPSAIKHIKLKEVLIPNLATLKSRLTDLVGDLYFCCLGTTIKAAGSKENFRKIDYDAIVDFAWIAQENKARSFTLVSAAGADSESKIFYNRVKGETENAVLCFNIRRTVIVRPGLLLGERSEFRLTEKMAAVTLEAIGPLLPAPWRRKIMTSADELAKRLIHESTVSATGPAFIESSQIR